jgi:putative transposase
MNSIFYWSDVLRSWIGERERMIVRYDPRDLSRIYLLARGTSRETAIFRALETMRKITDDAVLASKNARRQRERRLRVIQGARSDTASVNSAETTSVEDEGEDTRQPYERMLPVEEW